MPLASFDFVQNPFNAASIQRLPQHPPPLVALVDLPEQGSRVCVKLNHGHDS